MLSNISQRRYIDRTIQELRSNLLGFAKSGDVEKLHRVRISLKKLRSLSYLFKKFPGCKTAAPDVFGMLKELNTKAGRIRDLDISIHLMSKLGEKKSGVFNRLTTSREQKYLKMRNQLKRYLSAITACRKLYPELVFSIPDSFLIKIINELISKAEKQFDLIKKKNFGKLHQSRKILKHIAYLNEVVPVKTKQKLQIDSDYLDKIQHSIGKWHDADEVLNHSKKHKDADQLLKKLSEIKKKNIIGLRSAVKNFSEIVAVNKHGKSRISYR